MHFECKVELLKHSICLVFKHIWRLILNIALEVYTTVVRKVFISKVKHSLFLN